MRLPQLLLAALAATALAAPTSRDQTLFQAKSPDTVTRARPHHGVFKTPFVVKGPPPPRGPQSQPPYAAAAAAAGAGQQQSEGKSYFKAKWTRPGDSSSEKKKEKGQGKEKGAGPTSCFCAGGSICCHAGDGLSCNYGVCGI